MFPHMAALTVSAGIPSSTSRPNTSQRPHLLTPSPGGGGTHSGHGTRSTVRKCLAKIDKSQRQPVSSAPGAEPSPPSFANQSPQDAFLEDSTHRQ